MMVNTRRFLEVSDIGVALLLTFFGALAVAVLPGGSTLRLILVAPVLLFAPGYLLLQAVLVPKRPPMTRVLHGVVSTGISLGMVGLVALSAAVVRGGFRPVVIVVLVTLTCTALAATGVYRRLYQRTAAQPTQVAQAPRNPRPRFAFRPRLHREPPRPIEKRPLPTSQPVPTVTATVAEPATGERATTGPAVLKQDQT